MHQGAHRAAARCARREDFRQALGRDAADGVDGNPRRRAGAPQKIPPARREARLARSRVDVAERHIAAAEPLRRAHIVYGVARRPEQSEVLPLRERKLPEQRERQMQARGRKP